MNPCPVCHADAAKLRTGSLGEALGVWCTQCGHKTDSVAMWEVAAKVHAAFDAVIAVGMTVRAIGNPAAVGTVEATDDGEFMVRNSTTGQTWFYTYLETLTLEWRPYQPETAYPTTATLRAPKPAAPVMIGPGSTVRLISDHTRTAVVSAALGGNGLVITADASWGLVSGYEWFHLDTSTIILAWEPVP